jgi:hypothetical protein
MRSTLARLRSSGPTAADVVCWDVPVWTHRQRRKQYLAIWRNCCDAVSLAMTVRIRHEHHAWAIRNLGRRTKPRTTETALSRAAAAPSDCHCARKTPKPFKLARCASGSNSHLLGNTTDRSLGTSRTHSDIFGRSESYCTSGHRNVWRKKARANLLR